MAEIQIIPERPQQPEVPEVKPAKPEAPVIPQQPEVTPQTPMPDPVKPNEIPPPIKGERELRGKSVYSWPAGTCSYWEAPTIIWNS